jgi:hypothetical protein
MTTAQSFDELANVCYRTAREEMLDLINEVQPDDFTALELFAMVTILRPVCERLREQQNPPAVLHVCRTPRG